MVRLPRSIDIHHGPETNLKELKSPMKENLNNTFKTELSPLKLLKSPKNMCEQNKQKPKQARPKTSNISKTQSAVPKSEVNNSKTSAPLTKSSCLPKGKNLNQKPSASNKKLTPNQAKSEPIQHIANLSKKIVSKESPEHIDKYIMNTQKKIREIQRLARLKRESLETSLARLEKETQNIVYLQKQNALNKIQNDNPLGNGSLPLIETFIKNERKYIASKIHKKINKTNTKGAGPKKNNKNSKASSISRPPKTETLYNNPTNNFNMNDFNTVQFEGSRASLTTHYHISTTTNSSKIPITKKKSNKNKKVIKRKSGEVANIKPKLKTKEAIMDSSAASLPILTEKELVKHTDSLIISSKKLQNATSTKRNSNLPDYIKLKMKRPVSTVKEVLQNQNEPKAEKLKSCLKKGKIEEKNLQKCQKMESVKELALTLIAKN